jgi:hypothetical protein
MMRHVYKPTEEEIRRECEAIRAQWSDRERHDRAGLEYPPAIEIESHADETTLND